MRAFLCIAVIVFLCPCPLGQTLKRQPWNYSLQVCTVLAMEYIAKSDSILPSAIRAHFSVNTFIWQRIIINIMNSISRWRLITINQCPRPIKSTRAHDGKVWKEKLHLGHKEWRGTNKKWSLLGRLGTWENWQLFGHCGQLAADQYTEWMMTGKSWTEERKESMNHKSICSICMWFMDNRIDFSAREIVCCIERKPFFFSIPS